MLKVGFVTEGDGRNKQVINKLLFQALLFLNCASEKEKIIRDLSQESDINDSKF